MNRENNLLSVERMAQDCVNCGICVRECAFLQEYGSPKDLAEDWLAERGERFPFECSLCGLCHGVCPNALDPSSMFLAMRRELVEQGAGELRQHRTIRAYERRGSSSLYPGFICPGIVKRFFFRVALCREAVRRSFTSCSSYCGTWFRILVLFLTAVPNPPTTLEMTLILKKCLESCLIYSIVTLCKRCWWLAPTAIGFLWSMGQDSVYV